MCQSWTLKKPDKLPHTLLQEEVSEVLASESQLLIFLSSSGSKNALVW